MIPRPVFSVEHLQNRYDNLPLKKSPTRDALNRFRQERSGYEPGASIASVSIREPGTQGWRFRKTRKSKSVRKTRKSKSVRKTKKSVRKTRKQVKK